MSTHGSAEATAELVLGEIVVVGLGPGDAGLLTRETLIWLESDRPRWLRTRIHPTIAGLPGAAGWASFDDRYEAADSFAALYQEISDALIDAALAAHAADGGPIVYAVPGHPTIGESTVALLRVAAPQQHVRVRIIPALSFLDALAPHLPVDPLRDSVQIVDGLELAAALDREPFGGGTMPIAPMRPALIGQVYNAATASAVKLALDRFYPHDHPVTVLRAGGVPGAEEAITVPLHALDHREAGAHDHLTSLFVPALPPERAVRTPEGLQAIVARLRAPDGCPWDREQTHQSIRANFIEETYEALDALDAGDMDAFREELGDVLLQVYLQAQMAEEGGDFILEDVYEAIGAKLVRRHPHVFGATVVADSGEVLQNWEQIKEAERRAKGQRAARPTASALDGVPRSMPALARAALVADRAARLAPSALRPTEADTLAVLEAALVRLRPASTTNAATIAPPAGSAGEAAAPSATSQPTAPAGGAADATAHSARTAATAPRDMSPSATDDDAALGDALLALASLARARALDPEAALTAALAAFTDRFRAVETRLRAADRPWSALTPAEAATLWGGSTR
jgi:tetrapyrrole methylase family protein/MazG family protein